MEINDTIDISYQYNLSNEIDLLKSYLPINTNFIIPDIPSKSLTLDYLHILLSQDNVDISEISMIKYYNPTKDEYVPLTKSDLPMLSQKSLLLRLYILVKSEKEKILDIQKRIDLLEKQIKMQQKSSNSLIDYNYVKKESTFIYENGSYETNKLDFIYLYASPLLSEKKNKEGDYLETHDYESEIDTIVNLMNLTNLQFEAEFTRANDEDFIMSLRKAPGILHISANVLYEKVNNVPKCFLCLENDGEQKKIHEDDISIPIKQEINSFKISLVVISSPNSKALGKCFYDSGISSVICIENNFSSLKITNEVNAFIKKFYNMIFKGTTISIAFTRATKSLNDNNFYLYSKGDSVVYNKPKGKLQLNHNCLTNCKFNKENSMKLFGRMRDFHKVLLLYIIDNLRIFMIYGPEGVGKKFFAKKIGKYLFEIKFFSSVYFIETSLISDEDIKAQIAEIELKNNGNRNHNDSTSSLTGLFNASPNKIDGNTSIGKSSQENNNKILVIVSFEKMQDNTLKAIEDIFQGLKTRHRNIYFLIAITIPNNDKSVNGLSFRKVRLGGISTKSSINLFTTILKSYENKRQQNKVNENKRSLNKTQIEEIAKSADGLPNEIYLRAGYIYKFPTNSISRAIKTTDIIQDITEEEFNQRVLFLFCVLYKGISKTELSQFIPINQIIELKGLPISKYSYKLIDDNIYEIDCSFIKYILPMIKQQYQKEGLISIFKIYSVILRNIVLKTMKDIDITQEFSAALNHGLWESTHPDIFNEYYKSYLDSDFPSMYYHEDNIRNIITQFKDLITVIITIDQNLEFIEYFEQISITLPTIMKHKNKIQTAIDLITIFVGLSSEYHLKVNEIRLLMLKYSITNSVTIITQIEHMMETDEEHKEFFILKLYELSNENNPYNDMKIYYEKAMKILNETNDYFDLARLNYYAGKCLCNLMNSIDYFDKSIDYGKKSNCITIIIRSFIAKALYELSNHSYAKAKNLSSKAKKIYTLSLSTNKIFQTELDILINQINQEYKRFAKDIFIFIESNQLLNCQKYPIISLANDSYSFKSDLQCHFSKNIEINYQVLTLRNFKQLFTYPGTFIFISSDDFDIEGNLYCEDQNGQSQKVTIEELRSIIQGAECTHDLIILSFINSVSIASEFIKRGFPNVVAYDNLYSLTNCLMENQMFLINYRKAMKRFVINMLIHIQENKTIFDAFTFAKNIFITQLESAYTSATENRNTLNNINGAFNLIQSNEDFNEVLLLLPSCTSHDYLLTDFDTHSQLENSACEGKIAIASIICGSKTNMVSNLHLYSNKVNERMYGRKQELYDLSQLVKIKRVVNIYGEEKCGKTLLGFELCKMQFMKNTFRQGVFYLDASKQKNIQKIDIIKNIKEKDENCMLIVIDNLEKCFKKQHNIIDSLPQCKIHYVLITIKKITDSIAVSFELRNKLNEIYTQELFNYFLYEPKMNYHHDIKSLVSKSNYIMSNIKKISICLIRNKGKAVDFKALKLTNNDPREDDNLSFSNSSNQSRLPVDHSYNLLSILSTGDKKIICCLSKDYDNIMCPYIEQSTMTKTD